MIVPVYSITATLSTLFVEDGELSEILSIFRAMYEAVMIISFF
jgi:Organic solute transporter Ostalpha